LYVGTGEKALLKLLGASLYFWSEGYPTTTSRVVVSYGSDGRFGVDEDGEGISPEEHPLLKCSILESLLTKMGGGSWNNLPIVNALSSVCSLQSHWHGEVWEISSRQGVLESPPQYVGKTDRTGTVLGFIPDPEIFGDIRVSGLALRQYLDEIRAGLQPGDSILLKNS